MNISTVTNQSSCQSQKETLRKTVQGFSQLELNHQQIHEEVGKRHREWVLFGDASKNVSDIFLSTDKESSYVKKDKQSLAGTRKSGAVLNENMAVEPDTHTDLHAKFSRYMFKPKNMRPLVDNSDIIASPEKQMKKRVDAKKPGNHNESVCTLAKTKNKQNRVGFISEVDESGSKGNTCCTSKELDHYSISFRKDSVCQGIVVRKDGSDDTPPCQTTSISTDVDNKTDTFTCTPLSKSSTHLTNRSTLQSGQMKTIVASSTLDKLSRFSCKDEPTAAQRKMESGTPKRGGTDFLRANSKVCKILNVANDTDLGQSCQTTIPVDTSKNVPLLLATDCTPAEDNQQGKESSTKIVSKCKEKHSEFSDTVNINHVQIANDGSVNYQSAISLKRECIVSPRCSNSDGCKGLFSGLSLFGCAELNNDVLDTDWDQEVLKKSKV